MTADRGMRASDQDREDAISAFREAYAFGRLGALEFCERSTAASAARTCGELRDLTADLPRPPAGLLPADAVASRPRRPGPRRARKAIAACLLILGAGAAGRVLPGAAALVTVLFLAALPLRPQPRKPAR